MLAAFTILFGTRKLDASERHEGMVAAIAFESVVKLVAFLCVGLFVTFGMFGGFGDLFEQAAALPERGASCSRSARRGPATASLLWLTVLSMLAIVLLPRQFQIAVVENVDERHLQPGRSGCSRSTCWRSTCSCCRSRSAGSCASRARA